MERTFSNVLVISSKSLLHELGHSANRDLYRDGRVRPVNVVKVQVVRAERSQRRFELLAHIVRLAVGASLGQEQAEFARKEDLLAFACTLEPLAEELLVVPVYIGRIPVRAATLVDSVQKL